MEAVILAGGLGTRLQDLFPDRPKGLVPILGKPFLHWQLMWLQTQGVSHVHIAGGYLADAIRSWMNSYRTDLKVTLSAEPEPLGTGGGLKFIESYLEQDQFFVLNGDSLAPGLIFSDLVASHNALISLAVTPIQDAGRYGTVEVGEENRIKVFLEKEPRENGLISAGVYLAGKNLFDEMPDDRVFSLERDVFPRLAEQDRMLAFHCPPPLLDMGTPAGLKEMEAYLDEHGLPV